MPCTASSKKSGNYELIFLGSFLFLLFILVFETGSCYTAQAGYQLIILLPPPCKCWDCRYAPLSQIVFLHNKKCGQVLVAHVCDQEDRGSKPA
jgi:hypothetical protein